MTSRRSTRPRSLTSLLGGRAAAPVAVLMPVLAGVLAAVLAVAGCASGSASSGPAPATGATSEDAGTTTSEPSTGASPPAVDATTSGVPRVDAVEARRLSPRLAALGEVRVAVPPGWKVDWVGVGYLHMGPGHFRYSGGAFAVVSSAMASGGLEPVGGDALAWLRAQPDVDVRQLRPVVVGGRRHPAVLVEDSAQLCGSPADSPEAAHHSCISSRGSVQAYLPLGDDGRTLVVSVGARPLGRHADEAVVADRRRRLQQLVDLVTVP